SAKDPVVQARLASMGVFIDNFVCTLSMLVVLLTGVWKVTPAIVPSQYTQMALGSVFPGMQLFMPLLFFVLGYMTIISYFCVGLKSARFLSPKWGAKSFIAYALFAFIFFSFFDQTKTRTIMSFVGGLLLTCNLIGVFRLRKEIRFVSVEEPINTEEPVHG
ncbi:MAG: sodium/alanine symporter protein, partial [Chlamydiota bacterium]